MHSREVVAEVLRLREAEGIGPRQIAHRTGLPIWTIRDWLAGKLPQHSRAAGDDSLPLSCKVCGHDQHEFAELPPDYVYLLGLYLGDGCISTHPRSVYKLRISLDCKYPGIVEECARAMQVIVPRNSVKRQRRSCNCFEVHSYSKSWPCLFPQHGPGVKHQRKIELTDWQRDLVEAHPKLLIRGLIQSDGCRFINTGRKWSHPRYAFYNVSEDIKDIFCDTCDQLGLHWTRSGAITIYVSRKADVARLDEFVGPKA